MNVTRLFTTTRLSFPPPASPGYASTGHRFANFHRLARTLHPLARLGLALLAAGAISVAPAAVDPGFNPNANGSINTVAVQPDGKIVIGGLFTSVGGTTRNRVARLNADGSLDHAFAPNANEAVYSSAVQADGKIVISGWFTTINSVPRNYIARLNPDGTTDLGYNADVNNLALDPTVQPDGKIVIVGGFHLVNGVLRLRIARLNTDGTLDAGFDPGANNFVDCAALQTDGKILVGGIFTGIGTTPRNQLARLNPDGTVDATFNPNPNSEVRCIAVQGDGKILIGGNFTTVGGVPRNSIARLNPDGTVDASFAPDANGFVNSMALQANGKIIIAGAFTSVAGTPRNYLARLLADGSLDASFDPMADNRVEGVTLPADGQLVIAGIFTSVGGTPRNSIARLLNEPATQALSVPSTTRVQWLRGGSTPESSHVSFELSSDGLSWTNLGAGTRIAGGWELSSLLLPPAGTIRARARTVSAYLNGGSGLVESVQPYLLSTNRAPASFPAPITQTLELGAKRIVLTGQVSDADGDVLDYQWMKGATVLLEDSIGAPFGGGRINIRTLDLPSTDSRFGVGTHQIALRVSDDFNPAVSSVVQVKVVDTTPPKLVVPSFQIVIVPSASNTVVNYPAATATDFGGPVTLAYSRNSGTSFPVGITSVTVTATDRSGNRSTDRFVVTVLLCTDLLSDLSNYLSSQNINALTKLSLGARLLVAKAALALNQKQIAVTALQSFINEAKAQRGKNLTAAQSDYMVAEATRIRNALD